MELLTKKEIAEHLKLYTPNGNPNIPVVTFLLRRIDADPYGKKHGNLAYPAVVLPEIKSWFWKTFKGELPKFIYSGERRYQVTYLPDENIA